MNEFKWNEADFLPQVGSEINGSKYSQTIIAAFKDEDGELLLTIGVFKTGDIICEDNESGLAIISSDCFGESWSMPWNNVLYWSYIPKIPNKAAGKGK